MSQERPDASPVPPPPSSAEAAGAQAQAATEVPGPADALAPDATLDKYRIDRALATDGFVISYLATDLERQEAVTIDEYLPGSIAGRGEGQRVALRNPVSAASFDAGLRAFLDESTRLAGCRHPSLPRVARCWRANGTAYREAPPHQGTRLRTLRDAMDGPPDEASLLGLIEGLSGALQTLHAAEGLHLDISPDSVLLLPDDRPLLSGFGAARRAVVDDRTYALMGLMQPIFVPPEQIDADDRRLGPWSDVYALAAVVRYCLEGRRFAGTGAGTPTPLAGAVVRLRERYPTLSYSARFLAALEASMSPSPDDRLRSIPALRTAFGLDVDESSRQAAEWPLPPKPLPPPPVRPPEEVAPAAVRPLGPDGLPLPVRDGPAGSGQPPAAPPPSAWRAPPTVRPPMPAARPPAAPQRAAIPPAPAFRASFGTRGHTPDEDPLGAPTRPMMDWLPDPPVPQPPPLRGVPPRPPGANPGPLAIDPPSADDQALLAQIRADLDLAMGVPPGPAGQEPYDSRQSGPPRPSSRAVATIAVLALAGAVGLGVWFLDEDRVVATTLTKWLEMGGEPARPAAAPPGGVGAQTGPSPSVISAEAALAAAEAALAGASANGHGSTPLPGDGATRSTPTDPLDDLPPARPGAAPPAPAAPAPLPPPSQAAPPAAALPPAMSAPLPAPAPPPAAPLARSPAPAPAPAPAPVRRPPPPPAVATRPTLELPSLRDDERAIISPTSPRELCEPRTQFALYRCMQTQCETPRWRNHPQCVLLRETDEVP